MDHANAVNSKTTKTRGEKMAEETTNVVRREETTNVVRREETNNMGKRDDAIFIGKKGPMSYVLAVVTQFNSGANVVTIKARGKVISTAVDVAEIVRHKFLTDLKVKSIITSTEDMTSRTGAPTKVSSIEIVLAK